MKRVGIARRKNVAREMVSSDPWSVARETK
jgi:hypothetical protein